MKRFINVGNQIQNYEEAINEFSFYCTVVDSYESFNGENVWASAKEFKKDYIESGGDEIERYLALIPKEFKTQHVLYKTEDKDAPESIKDRNDEVVLSLCRVCGKGEADLEEFCN